MAAEQDSHSTAPAGYKERTLMAVTVDKEEDLLATKASKRPVAGVPPGAWAPRAQCYLDRTATRNAPPPAVQTILALVVVVAVLDFPQLLKL